MLAEVTLRPMVAADLPEVMEIERLIFPAPWTPGLFLHELKIPFSRLHVARTEQGRGTLVGYVCWWVVGDEAHLLNLAVHPDYRRKSLGRHLVGHVIEDAMGARAASVSLEVGRENLAALSLYQTLRFKQAGIRRKYYANGADALIMVRPLEIAPVRAAALRPNSDGRRRSK